MRPVEICWCWSQPFYHIQKTTTSRYYSLDILPGYLRRSSTATRADGSLRSASRCHRQFNNSIWSMQIISQQATSIDRIFARIRCRESEEQHVWIHWISMISRYFDGRKSANANTAQLTTRCHRNGIGIAGVVLQSVFAATSRGEAMWLFITLLGFITTHEDIDDLVDDASCRRRTLPRYYPVSRWLVSSPASVKHCRVATLNIRREGQN